MGRAAEKEEVEGNLVASEGYKRILKEESKIWRQIMVEILKTRRRLKASARSMTQKICDGSKLNEFND